ncbi:MAG: bacillithiol biosynthesis BshC [Planctomycetota bacterium]|nr:bacillithiol biosynthesis BshC [Planctomycetota bacterium]
MKTRIHHLPADVLGLSEVARAGISAGADFGPVPVISRTEDIPNPAEALGSDERGALVDLMSRGLEGAGVALAPAARDGLEALRQEGVSCVLTGQQPGFLTSPLYSLYKAIQACKIAKELSARWGAPVVPVFWNHADDHDIAEVHHAWQLNRNLDLQKVGLAGLASGRTPVGELPVDAEAQRLEAVRAQLRGIVEEHAGADATLDLFMPRDGETLARAFTRTLSALAGQHGLVVCEPAWIRPTLSSEMAKLVSGPSGSMELAAALRAGEAELRDLGLEAAIPVDGADGGAGAALIYQSLPATAPSRSERTAHRASPKGLLRDGDPGERTPAEVGSLIVGNPEHWSAGALVRPLVQDATFPTCAYVGGLGELAYHAQLGPAREQAGQQRTPFVPRVSLTLVDGDTRYALTRVGAEVEDVLRAAGAFQPDATGSDEPEVLEALRRVSEEASAALTAHRSALAALEPALGITLKKTAEHVRSSIGKVIDKATRVHQNRAGKGARQVRRVNHTLMPRGVAQERVLGPFQFIARFGSAFVDALWREIPPSATEHLVLHLEEEGDLQ